MITVYLVCLGFGGTLLLASVLLGHSDADFDADVDADIDADAEHEVGSVDVDGVLGWMPITSVRFWVFFLAFFGGTGLAIKGFAGVHNLALQIPIAAVMGYLAGFIAVRVIRALQSKDVDSTVTPSDFVGETVKVLVAVSKERPGKIQLDVKGQAMDLIATTEENLRFERGDSVILYAVDERGYAVVAKADLPKAAEGVN